MLRWRYGGGMEAVWGRSGRAEGRRGQNGREIGQAGFVEDGRSEVRRPKSENREPKGGAPRARGSGVCRRAGAVHAGRRLPGIREGSKTWSAGAPWRLRVNTEYS